MYFLTEEEKKKLLKGYLPKSRQMQVSEELRGWNWNKPPLDPVYEVKLALYEIASKYCPTGRDVYLRRILKIKAEPNKDMIIGLVLHSVVSKVLSLAKKLIYDKGVHNINGILKELQSPSGDLLNLGSSNFSTQEIEDLEVKIGVLWRYEYSQIFSRLQQVLSKQPYIGEDSLVALAIPVIVEQKLDGSLLGLSQHLSADAFIFSEPMILDLKFGEQQKFHCLTTTGYALVMESVYEFPVNLGCVVYPKFDGDRIFIGRDFHLIDEELRQWFVEERDEKMRMLYEEMDPGIAENCYKTCPYYSECHKNAF